MQTSQRHLYEFLGPKGTVSPSTMPELKALVERYPYFHLARLTLLRLLYQQRDPEFNNELRRAALYLPSRETIFNFVEADKMKPRVEEKESVFGGAILSRKPNQHLSTTQTDGEEHRTESLIDSFLNSVPKPDAERPFVPQRRGRADATVDYISYMLEEQASMSAEESLEAMFGEKTAEVDSVKSAANAAADDALATGVADAANALATGEAVDAALTGSTAAASAMGTSSATSNSADSTDAASNAALSTSAPSNAADSIAASSGSLDAVPAAAGEEGRAAVSGDGQSSNTNELIDQFIQKQGDRRIKLKDKNDSDLQKPVLDVDNAQQKGAFTETLARIYIKQGKFEHAIEIIQRLSLKYPKKNRYFADQIRFLEKIIANNKAAKG